MYYSVGWRLLFIIPIAMSRNIDNEYSKLLGLASLSNVCICNLTQDTKMKSCKDAFSMGSSGHLIIHQNV